MTARLGTVLGLVLMACRPAGTPPVTVTPQQAVAPPPSSSIYAVVSGGVHLAEVRSSLFAGTPAPTRAVSQSAVDVVLQPRAVGIGMAARITQSTRGVSDLNTLEASALLGSPAFAIEAAYVRRAGYSASSGLLHDTTYTLGRAGLRVRTVLGNSGFAAQLRAGYYLPLGGGSLYQPPSGWEGESGVMWSSSRWPASVYFGYRLERFAVRGMEQEVSAILAGAGFTLGGRR